MIYELSEVQRAAVSHGAGPALVLAGPGSGKTTVITNRSVRLAGAIRSPERLLCVTFTRAAAAEMRERYKLLAGVSGDEVPVPVFSTVHAYCNGIVGMYERKSGRRFERIEGEDSPKNEILSRIYEKFNGVRPDEAMLARLKGYFRKEAEGPAARRPSGSNQIRRYSEIAREYERVKRERGYLDFDDMIAFALKLLRTGPELRREVQGRFDYIQVDEAQDLSRSQYEVIRLIAPGDNIFIVADDDQSIYGFRGAEPECLFEFVKEFPNTARYELTRNYRSTPEIVGASAALVSVNQRRFTKDLFTLRPEARGSAAVRSFTDAAAQAKFCAAIARRAAIAGETVCVLYRNGMSSLPVRLALSASGIPYLTSGSCPDTTESSVVRAFLRELAEAERRSVLIIPSPAAVLKKLLREGFAKHAEEQCRLEGRDRKTVSIGLDFLKMLTAGAASYTDCLRRLDTLKRFDTGGDPGVTLSTIHSAKGLEYDLVLVIDVLEGELPGSEAAGAALEDERRLLYVAMTRAKKRLILCYPEKRGIRGEEASRFLAECAIDNPCAEMYNLTG
ncbi:MAG: ATP-dependent helicase [Clostridia bacterium]|nr:ATP-dependent helicase [Clostridia bacterium]